MVTKRAAAFPLAVLLGLAAAAAARADDTALLNRATPAPNVLMILDTSQSMTWYDSTGDTWGDEFKGRADVGAPMARMAMAKSVLSTVVDTYFDKLALGLASYTENGTPANPNANVRIKEYWYDCPGSGEFWCGFGYPYDWLIPPTSSLAYDGSTSEWNNLKLLVNSANLNMPSQPSYTLNWNLDPSVSPNPERRDGGSGISTTYCTWDVTRTDYNPDGTIKAGYPTSYEEDIEPVPCQTIGKTGTLTGKSYYDGMASGDDPYPYKYHWIETWTGYNVWGPYCVTSTDCPDAYATYQGPGWTDEKRVYTYNGKTYVYGDPFYWYWRYYYKGTCTSGCSGFDTVSENTATQDTPAPVLPSPWTIPSTYTYTWTGNNYEMNPPSAEASCPVGGGITVLVDLGSSPDKLELHNYLGTGTDPTKELHGANRYTPLAASLDTTRTYFTNPAGAVQTDPQKDCRKNFVILITDGGESCALVPLTGPGSPGSKAAALLNASINALGGATTYVVGVDGGTFGVNEQAVLQDIASKGSTKAGATWYSASDTTTLLAALNTVIGSILSQTYGFVSPWVPSVRTSDSLLMLQGSFTTPLAPPANPNAPWWQGSLQAYPLTSQGTIATSAQKITVAPLWEAGAVLATTPRANRKIYTVTASPVALNSPVVTFAKGTTTAAATLRTRLAVTLDVNLSGAVDATNDPNAVIDVVKGGGTGVTPGTTGVLGDIFHSSPLLVGPPALTYVDRTFDPADPTQLKDLTAAPDTFAAFRSLRSTRQRLAVVGANDGMLHAFNAGTFDSVAGTYNTGDGSEVWGFIPPQMLPKLQNLALNNGHQYFVDASPRVADVWLDGTSSDGTAATAVDGIKASKEWHTVLVGGFRQGGTGLYALDITNTSTTIAPKFLWTFATTGQSWSEPAFGKVKVRVAGRLVDRWVVFVGDGWDPTGTAGKKVHVIDIQTGKVLWQFTTTGMVAAGPVVVGLNSGGYVDRVYVGTVAGDVVRLDVSAVGKSASGGDVDPAAATPVLVATCASVPTSSSTCWYGSTFFSAGTAQPFYTKMAATTDPNGKLWLFAGSGDRSNPLLAPATPYRAYGIQDPYPVITRTLTEADLTNMTSTNTLDPSAVTGYGWFLTLGTGEKEWADIPLVFNRQVFFTTFKPESTACGDVGSGYIYMVYYLTGGGVTDSALFTASTPQASGRTLPQSAGVTSRPVFTTGAQGTNAVVYLTNSAGLTISPSFTAPSSIRSTRYWMRVLP